MIYIGQKMEFSIKNFFSKWSHLLKKSLMENFIFCAVIPLFGTFFSKVQTFCYLLRSVRLLFLWDR